MSTRKGSRHVVFKEYQQDQGWLFPPSLGQMIPANHKARLINDVIDGMDLDTILSTYKGGGTSAYHPRALLKILVYGYVERIYSSRRLERACHENICFMWLAGMQQPDHGTINSFRRHRLHETVKEVFAQVLLLLVEQGYVQLKDYHVDGTIMESVANRYTYVWRKNAERYKASTLDKINQLLSSLDGLIEREEQADQCSATDSAAKPQLSDSKAVEQAVERINEQIGRAEQGLCPEDKEAKKKLNTQKRLRDKIKDKHLAKLRKYEQQQELLNGRSSYSKTDPDATFMRTKDDHLGNGQLKPCYNIQVGSEQQFIVNYTIHQTPSDMVSFEPHLNDTLEMLEGIGQSAPENIVADAGYGSEHNYAYLEQNEIQPYVKYAGYDKKSKRKNRRLPFAVEHLYYNEAEDFFVCPMGQRMHHVRQSTKVNWHGEVQQLHHYVAQNCVGCPLRKVCYKSEKPRREITFNHSANNYRRQAKKLLDTKEGKQKRIQRNIDVEAVFGHIKQDRGFRRFLLTGLDGVNIEMGLLAIANNFIKWHNGRQADGIPMPSPDPKSVNNGQIAEKKPKNSRFYAFLPRERHHGRLGRHRNDAARWWPVGHHRAA